MRIGLRLKAALRHKRKGRGLRRNRTPDRQQVANRMVVVVVASRTEVTIKGTRPGRADRNGWT